MGGVTPGGGEGRFRAAWAAVTLDCVDVDRAVRFWSGLLQVEVAEPGLPGWGRTTPTVVGGPVLTFQPVDERKSDKTRAHLDLWTDDLGEAIAWVRRHGGRYTGEFHAYDEGTVAVMEDTEGIEFCLVGPPHSTPPA